MSFLESGAVATMSNTVTNSGCDKCLSDLHGSLSAANARRMNPIHYDVDRLEEGTYDITLAEIATTPHGKKVRVILSDRGRGRVAFYLGSAYNEIFTEDVMNKIRYDPGYLQLSWNGREGKYFKYLVVPRDQENWQ